MFANQLNKMKNTILLFAVLLLLAICSSEDSQPKSTFAIELAPSGTTVAVDEAFTVVVTANEGGKKYRLGALSIGYKGYKAGVNSEWVRHYVQNVLIHGIVAPQRMFLMTSNSWNGYFQYKTPNPFTSW
jgi:hypothetical protein